MNGIRNVANEKKPGWWRWSLVGLLLELTASVTDDSWCSNRNTRSSKLFWHFSIIKPVNFLEQILKNLLHGELKLTWMIEQMLHQFSAKLATINFSRESIFITQGFHRWNAYFATIFAWIEAIPNTSWKLCDYFWFLQIYDWIPEQLLCGNGSGSLEALGDPRQRLHNLGNVVGNETCRQSERLGQKTDHVVKLLGIG